MTNELLNFPGHIWRTFAENRAPIRCSTGFLIYLQGTEATCFYYLKQGRVKSYIQSEDGAERVLHIYEAGSLFGEASFFDELPRVSSAVALCPCQLVPIDRALVTREIAAHPDLALAMLKYLSRTVRLLSGHVDQMAFHSARWRVAQYLLTHADSEGILCCNQEEIASSVSISRVTVNRILNDFARRGLLANRYRQIFILKRDLLAEVCRPENERRRG